MFILTWFATNQEKRRIKEMNDVWPCFRGNRAPISSRWCIRRNNFCISVFFFRATIPCLETPLRIMRFTEVKGVFFFNLNRTMQKRCIMVSLNENKFYFNTIFNSKWTLSKRKISVEFTMLEGALIRRTFKIRYRICKQKARKLSINNG